MMFVAYGEVLLLAHSGLCMEANAIVCMDVCMPIAKNMFFYSVSVVIDHANAPWGLWVLSPVLSLLILDRLLALLVLDLVRF